MLITHPRHSASDLQDWDAKERYDAKLGPLAESKARKAIDVITSFHADGACYASTSWGKDSTVLVDLIGRSGANIPIVSLVIDGYEQSGTGQVRDMMLDKWPHLVYDELVLPPQPNRWWDDTAQPQSKYAADIGWRMIADRYGPRRLTGIRAEESRIRSMVQARWGEASRSAARPIGTWTAVDVFAYLAEHELPVHPAYAMSHGGKLDRRWLRVHALGGVTGADRGRADWEQHYFGDVIADSRVRDAILPVMTTQRTQAQLMTTIAAEAGTSLGDTHRVLAQLRKAGRVGHRSHHGSNRFWRTCQWPPEPTWKLPEKAPQTLI